MTTEGYVRVIAGPGSGKTKTLTARYAYIVKGLGIQPSNILCVTFTNKAAQEMKKRVRKMIGDGYDTGLITTYHGFCVRVLREDINHLYYPKRFIVLDEEDQKAILQDIYDELNLNLRYNSFERVLQYISMRKNNDSSYVKMLSNVDHAFNAQDITDLKEKIFLMYLNKQKKVYGLDFNDLINFTIVLFEDFPEVLEKWQARLNYIQVDEFQDSNSKDFYLVKRLSEKNGNLFVVGDPDQTIYEWRGAQPEILVNFDKDFPSCKTIVLDQNYRSTPEILSVSNSLIKRNKMRVDKDMITYNQSGIKVMHYHGKSEEDEVKWIIQRIKYINKNCGAPKSSIAILYRAHYLSRYIEQGLIEAGIDYTIYGGIKFFQRKEIKDALAYLRLIAYGDDLSFLRIINVPRRRIGREKINYLLQKSEEENTSLYEALKKYCTASLFKGTKAKDFVEAIEYFRNNYRNMAVSELLRDVLHKTGYEEYLRKDGDLDRLDNIAELFNSIVNFEHNEEDDLTLENYLQQIALYTDADRDDKMDSVKLMTIHTAKGLEFPYVFLCGLSEGILPNSRSLEERKEKALEEERRLTYVAITRAMKEVYLTESEGISNFGTTKYPSRFIFEIEEGLLDRIGEIEEELIKEAKAYIEKSNQKINGTENIFKEGDAVSHPVFGNGMIQRVDMDKKMYIIKFDNINDAKPISFSYKNLMLKSDTK
ncbi:ATP-dependent DNA helicase PcrA [Thermoclostridium stercorarium subsp. thermolacticum DSM 2910]|uniref:DNA 3'-5' helicase n=1 Tax=Thermoclostridium stercorarium subsp. thermolacticum DSM 2910 TaxID=1121336 RepID=A0A1B1YDE0_THEST|nr:UvrD-helicase domain-containing protein [Thermoclostridium stercorarium]ANW98779.1 ATP-dependent DNA helicase PcrA [Thermoclostridium stercorarium subsp. thermolacticum DSM 2910]